MAANKIPNIQPTRLAAAAANILNCAITSLAGSVGITLTQPYLIVKHIRITNVDTATRTVNLFKGATGGSAAGTEFAFSNFPLPAQSSQDWFGNVRFDSTDFLTGFADVANKVTVEIDSEIGFS